MFKKSLVFFIAGISNLVQASSWHQVKEGKAIACQSLLSQFPLSPDQVESFFEEYFGLRSWDRQILFVVDLPPNARQLKEDPARAADADTRLRLVQRWAKITQWVYPEKQIEVLVLSNERPNNGALPETGVLLDENLELPISAKLTLEFLLAHKGRKQYVSRSLSLANIVLGITQSSLTKPLNDVRHQRNLGGFRAATLPGFTAGMFKAFDLNRDQVSSRTASIAYFANLVDTMRMNFSYEVDGERQSAQMDFDLRFRSRAAGENGIFHKPGPVLNLLWGEAFVVPYEGEVEGEPSKTQGTLPLNIEGEIVLTRVEEGKIVQVLSTGEQAMKFARLLEEEPNKGHLAELGFGVLEYFGVTPADDAPEAVLLNEKISFHVGMGLSAHFPQGQIDEGDFNDPGKASHQDYVFFTSDGKSGVWVESAYFQMGDGRWDDFSGLVASPHRTHKDRE